MSNALKSKYLLGVTIVAAFVVAFAMFATTALAYVHTVTLRQGSTGPQVVSLQQALGITADGKFGPMTKASVMAYQSSHGLTADGVVGPMTGASLAGVMVGGTLPAGCTSTSGYSTTTGQPCNTGSSGLPAGCTSTVGYSPTTGQKCDGGASAPSGPLTGGSGSVESYELAAGFSNEEVGEDSEDVKVVGLEIENSDTSDIRLTALRIVFDEGTAGSDFSDYASEVTVWLGSTKVATIDGDEFNDDNNWTKTVSLDSSAVIGSDDTETLYVAISGVSNLDTNDAGDTWTVDLTSVRFVDAQGSSISEDPGVAATTFSFESFATSQDTELSVTEGGSANEDINDAHIINIHATDDTNNVPILAFEIEIEGDSDVTLDSLPVTLTSVEGTGDDPDDLITTLYLFADGVEIGSETLSTADANGSTEVVVFDDLDFELKAGDKVDFVVKGKFVSVADALDVGDTIQATFGETETDLATFDVEDESGEDLVDADKTGTVTGGTHELRDVSLIVELVGTPTAVRTPGEVTVQPSDIGTFTFVFDVTAVDGDIFIDETAPAVGAGATETDLAVNVGTGTITGSIASISGGKDGLAENVTNSFRVDEDETNRFQITVDVRDGGTDLVDGFHDMTIVSILYALTDVDGDLLYTSNMDRFVTPQIFLNDGE
jgi:hypothetical protein